MLGRARLVMMLAAGVMAAVVLVVSIVEVANHDRRPAPQAGVPAPLAVGTALQRPRALPEVHLVAADGRPFSLRAWRGRWVVLAPSLTLCSEVCPMTTGALMALGQELRAAGLSKRVEIAEATIDPWRDTPYRLRAYARLTGAKFSLLTGSPAQIHRLWHALGVYYVRVPEPRPPDTDWLTHRPLTFDVDHTNAVFIIDPAGQERIVEDGMPNVGGRLEASLRKLLDAAGLHNLAHPDLPWTPNELLEDLDNLMNINVPQSALASVSAPSASVAAQELANSPQPLAALHSHAGQLLGSGAGLTQELRALRGYPVVLNVWASWCGPCRSEFSLLAAASAHYGRKVAFLGNDTNDSAANARPFLTAHPVSYPSFQDSESALGALAQIEGLPTTIFLDRSGRRVYVHTGSYDTPTTLDQDIERYALRSG